MDKAGWDWNADYAEGVDYPDASVLMASIVVRGIDRQGEGFSVAARWEDKGRTGKLSIAKCYMRHGRGLPIAVSVTEVFQYIT